MRFRFRFRFQPRWCKLLLWENNSFWGGGGGTLLVLERNYPGFGLQHRELEKKCNVRAVARLFVLRGGGGVVFPEPLSGKEIFLTFSRGLAPPENF